MKVKAERNRTIYLSPQEQADYSKKLLRLDSPVGVEQILNRTICQDTLSAIPFLPDKYVDLLFIDPPYNLDKEFNGRSFRKKGQDDYLEFLETCVSPLLRLLKQTASVYICSDYNACGAVQLFAEKHLKIRNRITWEREKGRGAKANWKNCSEDIWFCTVSDNYTFNADAVKLKRKVIAPYTIDNQPKDWQRETNGDFRLTHPSNLWTDLTVPFWSMPENTDHPTQKPEKLLAKIILAGSNEGDIILDPFLGSGTTSVVAKKLGRNYVGIEIDQTYCCLAEKRLESAENDKTIQGFADGVFWERNSTPAIRALKVCNK
jgi:site-specific DNA-methyltransferase (adenine-specific)